VRCVPHLAHPYTLSFSKYNKLYLEKGTTYLFEIKVQISDILKDIEKIENKQNRFINALKHVEINGVFPDAKKDYKSIFMCDHNPIYVRNKAIKDEKLKSGKSSLLYSGVQLGITFVNTLNNNIKGLNKKIDDLEERDESKNKKKGQKRILKMPSMPSQRQRRSIYLR